MKNEPKCPWCGRQMIAAYNPPDDHMYRCLYCPTNSPIKYTPQEAWKAAISRPMQKPLTLEELTKSAYQIPCWIEGNTIEPFPEVIDRDSVGLFSRIATAMSGFTIYCDLETYGKTWRAWATRPTDEERAAAPWEGTGDADL